MISQLARIKQLFARGQGWLYILKDIALLSLGMWAFQEVLSNAGIQLGDWFIYLYPILVVGYPVSGIVIGYLDEKYGIWKAENVYGTIEVNPAMKEMYDKINEIYDRLN